MKCHDSTKNKPPYSKRPFGAKIVLNQKERLVNVGNATVAEAIL